MKSPFRRMPKWFSRGAPLESNSASLRDEHFTVEQLDQHAASLAGQHNMDPQRGSNRLLSRLAENERSLTAAYNLVSEAEARQVAPDGEWLLDNFYLIEQQFHASRLHLPKTYSRELPRLLSGPQAGFPRVYSIALELIAHSEGHVDMESVSRFVAAYQTVKPLKLGELWAVPIMLRLGLIESLRRVSEHIARRRQDRNLANIWADRLLRASEKKNQVLHVLAEMDESAPLLSNHFVEEFCARMQGQSPELATVQSWLQHRLASEGLTREQLQRVENQIQATDQVLIGHSISSLRSLGAMDWKQFIDSMSFVETTLRSDPCGIYPKMDFATRNRYRQCIEKLSLQSGEDEITVALKAIRLAQQSPSLEGSDIRKSHVGFYLIDKGAVDLERDLQIRFSLRRFLTREMKRFPVLAYVGSITAITAFTVALWWGSSPRFTSLDWRLWLLLIPGILVISQMAVSLVNLTTTLLVGPRPLPRLDFLKGIPDQERTMVVIPTLLDEPKDIADLLEGLELRYVGNRDANLTFALLTDFCDAREECQEQDEERLQIVRQGIRTLNERYQPEGPSLFYLFHRPRRWNPHEQLWMGYERKRGKLEQFNALLRGGPLNGFSEIIGDLTLLPGVRYVVTLDTDTALPRDAARRLVGTMAHPLNHPRYDPETGRVVEGYAILQPHTPISLTAANRSHFARLSSGEAGIDPYTREISDVYQDLFGEGTYVGKGIYEVDAFRRATEGRFPENLILSHDLVESSYARSTLVSDVELQEDHPASFVAEMSRRHRWIRGDWQIAGWLFPRVLGAKNQRVPNTLTALGWWKIFDNLRRSLVPPALLALLAGGWLLLPEPVGFWTSFAVLLILLPLLTSSFIELIKKPRDRDWRQHFGTAMRGLGKRVAEAGLALAALPYRAAIHLDAILVSAGRMPFTRRGLLLWHTPRYAKRNRCGTPGDFLREMWIAPTFALAMFALLAITHPAELITSGPLLLLWFTSPLIAWWVSRPVRIKEVPLTETQRFFLRGVARDTWRYFEIFATEEENWLAPDNYQESSAVGIASRTSPTNIGMGLLANLSAIDFGYLSNGQLLDRTTKAFDSMDRLVRYRGHFYNWYDTRTLAPLPAYYISSVDSGNLVGSLLTLRAGLLELKDRPLFGETELNGLRDTLDRTEAPPNSSLRSMLECPPAADPSSTLTWLEDFCLEAGTLPDNAPAEKQWWTGALVRQAEALRDDFVHLTSGQKTGDRIPTLQELAGKGTEKENASLRLRRIDDLARRCNGFAKMDFTFLHDPGRDLLSIGYNVSERRLDASFYDLLASEARLASYILVAQGHLQPHHWFSLGRQVTNQKGAMALLSWSGSMFEYLMPLIWMPTHAHTFLDETYRAVVDRQIEYGRQRGVPWGVSESCYNLNDAAGIHQYSAFGVPGLGFKRGLAEHLVIAPYASALALMVKPSEACHNLERLADDGYRGTYGMFEAIDFTPSRVPRGHSSSPLHTYMAHHQGMSLLSISAVLHQRPMQRRFLADPFLKASELLLWERIPQATSPLQPHAPEVDAARQPPTVEPATLRFFSTPHTPVPEVQLLSNSRYHVMVTNAGGGYSRWNNFAVTRWREDAASDGWGTFCYLRDTETGTFWSAAYQPTRRSPDYYEAIFAEGRAEFRRRDEEIDAHTEIAVSPEHDVEVRRITLTNLSPKSRSIELTSFAEVVLAPPNSDLAHPAFSNLFVQTEILHDLHGILCTRRARAPGENPPWMFHLVTTQGATAGEVSYETNRGKFLGRTRTAENPAAFDT
ncbi:MAG: hypothetical protein JJT75_00425, partial [Opitutales bacterium]|nr:hypothetical protein [Opitutales bacterium]